MPHNTVISICKALAIILMVIGHADCPDALGAFLYEFHMPLFFITAGYFFSVRYINDEATFVKKRFKGLYLPFVTWSVFFLILHNTMFDIGILNEQYGNWTGGVTHPYSPHRIQQNLWTIFTAMGGYDEFLCGAFWFFRGLLVASIGFLVCYKISNRIIGWTDSTLQQHTAGNTTDNTTWSSRIRLVICNHRTVITTLLVCLIALLLAGWKAYEGLRIITLVQGGYRELMGMFFFGCGFLFRQWEGHYKATWWSTLVFGVVVWLFSHYLTANMNWRSTYTQFLTLPIPAFCGFLMTYNIARWLDRHPGRIHRFLVYCGDHTLPIFVFHIISYKVVSLLKIAYYDLDFAQIGCHMVIHYNAKEDYFWILYAIAGVGIPLGWTWCYHKLKPVLDGYINR